MLVVKDFKDLPEDKAMKLSLFFPVIFELFQCQLHFHQVFGSKISNLEIKTL